MPTSRSIHHPIETSLAVPSQMYTERTIRMFKILIIDRLVDASSGIRTVSVGKRILFIRFWDFLMGLRLLRVDCRRLVSEVDSLLRCAVDSNIFPVVYIIPYVTFVCLEFAV